MRVRWIALVGLLLAGAAAAEPPNLIVIVSDDQGTNAVSAYGPGIGGVVSTPNIDRIANDGVKFTNAFGVDQVCAPNRATLMTGKYGHRNGVLRNGDVFDGSQTTVADLLKAAGYRTAIIGKWHLKSSPGEAGFDDWNVFSDTGIPYTNPNFDRNGVATPSTGYATDLITDDALAWLAAHRDDAGPFALFIMHRAPHDPFVPAARHRSLYAADLPHTATFDDRWSGRTLLAQQPWMRLRPDLLTLWLSGEYRALGKAPLASGLSVDQQEDWIYQQYAKDYLRTLTGLDESVGSVLDYLDANRDESGFLVDDTVVIYTGDNGNLVGEHFSFAKQRPYEEILRVPFLMRGPGVARGTVVGQVVLDTDVAPTLLDFAGVATPKDMQGRSMLELLNGPPPKNWRTSFYFNHYGTPAQNIVPYSGIRTSRYKLIMHDNRAAPDGGVSWELIDLEADPDERTNVYNDGRYADAVAQLRLQMVGWQTALGIPPSITSCPGDANLDGVVSMLDMLSVRKCVGSYAEGICTTADFDGNGIVNSLDWLLTGRRIGTTCPP